MRTVFLAVVVASVILPTQDDAPQADRESRRNERAAMVHGNGLGELARLEAASPKAEMAVPSAMQNRQAVPEKGVAHLEELGAAVDRDAAGKVTSLRVTGPRVEDDDLRRSNVFESLGMLVLGDSEPRNDGWQLTDRALAKLGAAQRLFALSLRGKGFTDRSLRKIAIMRRLQSLQLNHTSVTDDGFKVLRRFSCEHLDLNGTRITGKGLAHIEQWKTLCELDLTNTLVDDRATESIARLTAIRFLYLNNTRMTDDGLKRISRLPALERLDLDGTDITDTGVRYLERSTKLKSLSLEGTKVSDHALSSLAKLRGLCVLDVSETAITPSGVERLGELLPNARVYASDVDTDDLEDSG